MRTDQEGLQPETVLQILRESGALLDGHFRLTSGLHSDQYLEKFAILQNPVATSRLCAEIARRYARDQVGVVMGPTTGGILLAYETARQLGVRGIFTERENGRMTLRRGFSIAPGERVLLVEDIVTTGGSVQEVLQVAREHDAEIVGIGFLVDRSNGRADFGVRSEPLLTMEVQAWSPEACPLCAEGQPFTKRGSKGL